MKLITAVVPPSRVEQVLAALRLFGVRGLTFSRVFASDTGGDPGEVYRGVRYQPALAAYVRLDILAANDDTFDLTHVIARAVDTPAARRTVSEIWVTPVSYAVRIRTGEAGLAAL